MVLSNHSHEHLPLIRNNEKIIFAWIPRRVIDGRVLWLEKIIRFENGGSVYYTNIYY